MAEGRWQATTTFISLPCSSQQALASGMTMHMLEGQKDGRGKGSGSNQITPSILCSCSLPLHCNHRAAIPDGTALAFRRAHCTASAPRRGRCTHTGAALAPRQHNHVVSNEKALSVYPASLYLPPLYRLPYLLAFCHRASHLTALRLRVMATSVYFGRGPPHGGSTAHYLILPVGRVAAS